MSISCSTDEKGKHTIKVSGIFDFSLHKEFRDSYEYAPATVHRYELNFRSTTYLDSSALGMLLLLREYAGGDNSLITITYANSEIKKILDISNFSRLFVIL